MSGIKYWLIIGVILGCSAVTASALSFDWETQHLKNGITVYYQTMPESKDVTARIIVPAGRLSEPKNLRGVSHLIEHLIFRGNSQYVADDFIGKIRAAGGYYNGFTFFNRTEYYLEVPAENLMPLLQIYMDLILNPGFSEKHLQLEKKIIAVEMATRQVNRDSLYLFWNAQTEEQLTDSLGTVTKQDLVNYHRRYYQLDQMKVIITGKFNPKEVGQLFSRLCSPPAAEKVFTSDWHFEKNFTALTINDYLDGENYNILFGCELPKLSGKELTVAKVLPYLLEYDSRNYDVFKSKPLDYSIDFLNLGDYYFLILWYRDCQDKYTPEIEIWHHQNLERYLKFLKTKDFKKFLTRLSDFMEKRLEFYRTDPAALNEIYDSTLFDPSAITVDDYTEIHDLSSNDFKNFVEKYLEKKSYQEIIIKGK